MYGNKPNPFEKFLTAEDRLNRSVYSAVYSSYPGLLCFHIPNEGKRTPFESYKFIALGGKAGLPDLMIPEIILVIEFKTDTGRLSKEQVETLNEFTRIGWRAVVCRSYDEALEIIKDQLGKYAPEYLEEDYRVKWYKKNKALKR